MAFDKVSAASAKKLAKGYLSLKAKAEKIKEAAAEAMAHGVQTLEVGGAAFGFGYLRGRMSDPSKPFAVFGVPTDLGVGFALHALAFLGAFDKYNEHGHNFGDGALASYLTFKGIQFGSEAKAKTSSTTGYDPHQLSAATMGADAMLADQIRAMAG